MFPAVVPDSSLSAVVAVSASDVAGVPSVLVRAVAVTAGWMVLTGIVGAILIAGTSSTAGEIRDDILERPDLAFATGFVVFFAPAVAAALPLFVSMYVEHPVVLLLAALVALPALLCWGFLLLVGGSFGVIAVGDRAARRLGTDAPSLRRALLVGTAAVGASLLVPAGGVVVAMGVATLGTGAAVRRRIDVFGTRRTDRDSGGDDGPTRSPTTDDREPAVPSAATVRRSRGTGEPAERSPSAGRNPSLDIDAAKFRTRESDQNESEGGAYATEFETEWSVDEWEMELQSDRESDDAQRSGGESR